MKNVSSGNVAHGLTEGGAGARAAPRWIQMLLMEFDSWGGLSGIQKMSRIEAAKKNETDWDNDAGSDIWQGHKNDGNPQNKETKNTKPKHKIK
jgi:hypothetical protein